MLSFSLLFLLSGRLAACQSPCVRSREPFHYRLPRGRLSPSLPMKSAAMDSKSPPTTLRRCQPLSAQSLIWPLSKSSSDKLFHTWDTYIFSSLLLSSVIWKDLYYCPVARSTVLETERMEEKTARLALFLRWNCFSEIPFRRIYMNVSVSCQWQEKNVVRDIFHYFTFWRFTY